LYSEYRENKLQVLTKMVVIYKQIGATIFAIALILNRGMDYWVSFFVFSSFFTTFKSKIHEEKSILHTIILT